MIVSTPRLNTCSKPLRVSHPDPRAIIAYPSGDYRCPLPLFCDYRCPYFAILGTLFCDSWHPYRPLFARACSHAAHNGHGAVRANNRCHSRCTAPLTLQPTVTALRRQARFRLFASADFWFAKFVVAIAAQRRKGRRTCKASTRPSTACARGGHARAGRGLPAAPCQCRVLALAKSPNAISH